MVFAGKEEQRLEVRVRMDGRFLHFAEDERVIAPLRSRRCATRKRHAGPLGLGVPFWRDAGDSCAVLDAGACGLHPGGS